MGFFRKKADPISERARALNQQIAALESEIERLSEQQENQDRPKPPSPAPAEAARPPRQQPRLRSTALPHGHSGATMQAQSQPQPANPPEEPALEDVNPFRVETEPAPPPERAEQLGVRNPEPASMWQRIKNNFRAQPMANPKLVNYLAAGSIHGLRPLRYERRVARNRFLLLVVALAIMLWGLLAVLL
jgi:hypothetical protein